MRTLFSILFLVIANSILAQDSQTVLAANYSDGEYNWHRNLSGSSNPESFSDDGPVNLKFIQNDSKEVVEIQLTDSKNNKMVFKADAYGISSFVRYYRSADGRCLYFDKKGIWVVEISSYDEEVERVNAFLGKKPGGGKKLMESITSYLQDTKKFQQKERDANTIVGKEIESIKVELVWAGEPVANGNFQIGITTTRADGVVLKNKPLGGKHNDEEFYIEIIQNENSENHYLYSRLTDCENLKNGKINVILKRRSDYKVVFNDWVEAPCFYSESHLKWEKELANRAKSENPSGNTVFKSGNKYGLKNSSGEILLEAKYDSLGIRESRTDGFVKQNSKYGVFDQNGKIIIEPIYDKLYTKNNYYGVKKDSKYGIFDDKGKICIPVEYDRILFKNGNYVLISNNEKWGCADYTGKVIVPMEYTRIGEFGLFVDQAPAKKDGKWGTINMKGETKIPFIYDDINKSFHHDKTMLVKKGTKWGFVDTEGKEVLPFIFEYDYMNYFENGLAIAGRKEKEGDKYKGSKFGLVDKEGNVVTEIVYTYIGGRREDGYYECSYKNTNQIGLLNSKGKLVLYPNYSGVGEFVNGYAAVRIGEHYGYINEKFDHVSPIIYDSGSDVTENPFAVAFKGVGAMITISAEKRFIMEEKKQKLLKYGEGVYIWNDTQKELEVETLNSGGGVENLSTVYPGEFHIVRNYENYSVNAYEKGASSNSKQIKVFNDPSQSGNVYRLSPYFK